MSPPRVGVGASLAYSISAPRSLWGAGLPRVGGRYQPLSTGQEPHASHPISPSSKHHPLVGSFSMNPVAAEWELRPSPFESLLSPLFAPGSPRPRSLDVSVGSDRGIPPSPGPYPSNASTSHPFGDRCLGSWCWECPPSPGIPSLSVCAILSECWLPAGPGDWTPGRLGLRLAPPRPSSLFLPSDASFTSLYLPPSFLGIPDSRVPTLSFPPTPFPRR